jgi:prepilin-type N-terminal cleavage/methylation domain-containing protein/prepilin-type processing-associated H-X9-DG protein
MDVMRQRPMMQGQRTTTGRRGCARRGFTLVELLVVVTIIVLLLSILLPALQKARDLAKEAVCMSSMRRIMLGKLMYVSEYPSFPDPTDTNSYDLHHSSNERRAARWLLFFNEHVGGEGTPDLTYAAWRTTAGFGPVASPVWNGCPKVIEAQNIERFHYGIFTVGSNEDNVIHSYPTFGLRPSNVPNAAEAAIIGEPNTGSLLNNQIQGDTLFYMKDFRLGERTGTGGFEPYQRHVRPGFNVAYLDGHVAFYSYPELTWYRRIVYDIVVY